MIKYVMTAIECESLRNQLAKTGLANLNKP